METSHARESGPSSSERERAGLHHEIEWLRTAFPELRDIEVRFTEADAFEGGAGGQFYVPDEDEDAPGHPEIILSGGDAESFERLKKGRRVTIEIIARQVGIPFEALDGETIRRHILYHEAGHAHDFLTNFVDDLTPESIVDCAAVWHLRGDSQLDELPISGRHPGMLQEEIARAGGFEKWKQSDADMARRCQEIGADSEEELLRLQEEAYRGLEKERFADAFAARAMESRKSY